MKNSFVISIVFGVVTAMALQASAGPWAPDISKKTTGARIGSFFDDHLKVGFRPVFVDLTDATRNPVDSNSNGKIDGNELLAVSYLGSIYKLDQAQDYLLPSLYARWMFTDWVGVDLSYENIRADAINYWSVVSGNPPISDGRFHLSGPVVSVILQYPNGTIFTPAAGAGIAFLSSDFDEDPYWHGVVNDVGIRQFIDTDNDVGFSVFGACDARLSDTISILVYLRYMAASVDAHYYIEDTAGNITDDRGITKFPFDSIGYGAGIQYNF